MRFFYETEVPPPHKPAVARRHFGESTTSSRVSECGVSTGIAANILCIMDYEASIQRKLYLLNIAHQAKLVKIRGNLLTERNPAKVQYGLFIYGYTDAQINQLVRDAISDYEDAKKVIESMRGRGAIECANILSSGKYESCSLSCDQILETNITESAKIRDQEIEDLKKQRDEELRNLNNPVSARADIIREETDRLIQLVNDYYAEFTNSSYANHEQCLQDCRMVPFAEVGVPPAPPVVKIEPKEKPNRFEKPELVIDYSDR